MRASWTPESALDDLHVFNLYVDTIIVYVYSDTIRTNEISSRQLT